MDDNVVEIVDTSPTSVLPCEILSQIFTFLPLVDRKCVRLTCRSWYNCCTYVNITKHEKFVFRTDPGGEHIAEVMLRSSSLLNLEFQSLPVEKLPANVWKTCGPRIRELEFHMCRWEDKTIRNIILHCENLTSLVITEDDYVDCQLIRIAYSPRLLDDFLTKGIRRPKLRTLSIYIGHDEHESVLRKISLLHPGIKHFTFKLVFNSSEFLDPFAIRLDKCLNSDRLESLTSVILTPRGKRGTLVNKDGQGFRLKYLETWLRYNDGISLTQENEIFTFFRSQENLEVIKLHYGPWISINNLFYTIFESCPKLREFCLDSLTWYLRPSEVSRFITSISKLKCLELSFELEYSEQVPSFFDLLPNTVQLDLTSLHWKNYPIGHPSDFCAAFLQRCSSLKHLRLVQSRDNILQIIFQHLIYCRTIPEINSAMMCVSFWQPELQTLVLGKVYLCTAYGFSGRTVDGNEAGYSIKRLQELKHLALSGYNFDLTEKIMPELQLPCLEFLSLCFVRPDEWPKEIPLSEEALNHCASHLPELRVLAIDSSREGARVEPMIQLCKQFNKLHRLIFPKLRFRLSTWEKQMIKSIFSACPSLRYVSDKKNNTHVRDPFTGNMLFKEHLQFSSGLSRLGFTSPHSMYTYF